MSIKKKNETKHKTNTESEIIYFRLNKILLNEPLWLEN